MIDRRLFINFDWLLLFLVLLAGSMGVVIIYSAKFNPAALVPSVLWMRQIYWMLIGLGLILVVISIDYHHLGRWAYFLYAINVILLVLVLFIGGGDRVNRWFQVGPLSIQPSEFMKMTMVLVLGRYFENNDGKAGGFVDVLITSLLLGIPLLLIIKQPDLGTALTLVPVFFIILLIANVKKRYLISMILIGVSAVPVVFAKLKPYQKQRILSFMDPAKDPLGSGYHLMQSKIAVGSGGLWGKGFLGGTQNRLNFLPAQHTDFIFSVLSEEWGFIGATVVLVLLFLIILRGLETALRAKDQMGLILATGIIATFAVNIVINVGMVIGLLPITGIPLPLISYGGSGILTTFAEVGLLLNIRMRRFSS